MSLKRIVAIAALCVHTGAALAAVDVNQASAMDLDGIKGIGPALSGRILEERRKRPFRDWSDFIARIQGIGSGNAASLSAEGLTVDGAAYKPGTGVTSR